MNKTLLLYSCFILFGTFISSISQVLLKKSADTEHGSFIKEYLNVRVIVAYALFFAATICTILAYREVPVSMGAVLEASGYIYVTIFDVKIFGQQVSKRKILALGMIITGICVYAILG